jgi:hypothetical protein
VVAGAEGAAALLVLGMHEVAVAPDVAVLAADDEQHEVVVAGVPEAPRRGRLDMTDAAGLELDDLAAHLEPGPAPVDEVELVLLVVVVEEPLGARREHHRVGSEGGDAYRPADLAEEAGTEVIDRRDAVRHDLSS